MTQKCASCNAPIEVVFLDKIAGTYLKNSKGKKCAVCSACQQKSSITQLRKSI